MKYVKTFSLVVFFERTRYLETTTTACLVTHEALSRSKKMRGIKFELLAIVGKYLRKAKQCLIQPTLAATAVPMKLHVYYDRHSKFCLHVHASPT